jgi:hypothetical protein
MVCLPKALPDDVLQESKAHEVGFGAGYDAGKRDAEAKACVIKDDETFSGARGLTKWIDGEGKSVIAPIPVTEHAPGCRNGAVEEE